MLASKLNSNGRSNLLRRIPLVLNRYSRQFSDKSLGVDTTKDSIESSKTYLVNNYGGIIPFVVKHAAGPFVSDGKTVLFDNCAAYSSVTGGHNAKPIIKAIGKFIDDGKAFHPSRAFYNEELPIVAKRYSDLAENTLAHPENGIVQIIPANGGVEAVEGALKVARRYKFITTGIADDQQITITCKGNFHGRTIEVIAGNEDPMMNEGFATNQRQFEMAEFNNLESLSVLFETFGNRVSSFLVEPIQGEGGVKVGTAKFFEHARTLCDQYGALFIADEVQTGGHRTGPFFASSHPHFEGNCQPDIITLGKAINPVLPVSMVLVRKAIGDALIPGTHGSTWGGNPFAMAISNATLDYYKDIHLEDQMTVIGATLLKTLRHCQDHNQSIKDVRGLGSMIAIEFKSAETAIYYKKRLFSEGTRQNISVTNELIENSPHFNYEKFINKPIQGIALKLTEEDRTMRVNPTILTNHQLECVCKLYMGALIETSTPEPDHVFISNQTPPANKEYNHISEKKVDPQYLNFLAA
tara:strand:- start:1828 stop:3399 length:1572 start_codon:yes stop_codon:yes gene_type:complete